MIIISSHLLTRDWAYAAPPATDDDDDGDDGVGPQLSSTSEYLIVSYDADDAILSYNCIAPPPTVVHQPVLRESPLLLNSATTSLFHRLA